MTKKCPKCKLPMYLFEDKYYCPECDPKPDTRTQKEKEEKPKYVG